MLLSIQEKNTVSLAPCLPQPPSLGVESHREAYERNCHRVYALAFWMTDNELLAEELMANSFRRVLASNTQPSDEEVDRALIDELRTVVPLGTLSLDCAPSAQAHSVRYSTLRADLERAVVQLPGTEKLIFLMHDVERYDHARIARCLGLTEDEARLGLHQARLRLRELLARSASFVRNN